MKTNDDGEQLAKVLFYICLASVIAYALVVRIFIF
jgi:hypothetical protein